MASGEKKGEPRKCKKVAVAEKQLRALNLRKAGFGYEKIAEELGYASPSGAHQAVMTALKNTLREPAEELRTLELERLDRIMLAYWQRSLGGDTEATDRVLKIMDRRAKLAGLDEAEKHKHEHTHEHQHDDVTGLTDEDLVARYRAKVRALEQGGG